MAEKDEKPADDTTETETPPVPDEIKAQFKSWMDEWADEREAKAPKPKTVRPPLTFLDSLFQK